MTETVQGLEEGAPVQTNQGPEGRPLNVSPARKGWVGIRAPGRAHSLGGVSPLHTRQGEVLAERQGCPP
jgi:hypothetical protein